MGRQDISLYVLKQVVADLGPDFYTKDVSEDPRMKKAHFDLVDYSHFHSFVGGALSDHKDELGIINTKVHNKRGVKWKKTAWSLHKADTSFHQPLLPSTQVAKIQNIKRAARNNQLDLGPQHDRDNLLARKLRKHQSWFRANELKLPYGTGPGPNDTTSYGNMLTRVDGGEGRNFLSPEIYEVVQDRIAQGSGAVEKYRLLHNMLSSQPMCFNLFGPLVRDLDLARTLLDTLIPERVSEVTRIDIEWSPMPASDYLNDHTAFDAFVEYKTTDGQLVGLGIETKLSEPFSQKEYDRPEYRRWMQSSNSPWLPESWNKVQHISHNQLWREHLLTVAMRTRPGSPYHQVRLLLIHHPDDIECESNYSIYKKLLKDEDDSLFSIPLNQIVDRWLARVKQEEHVAWLKAFNNRYVDLELSKGSN
jgi:hypothetical protein